MLKTRAIPELLQADDWTSVGKDDLVDHVDDAVVAEDKVAAHARLFHHGALSITLEAQLLSAERPHGVFVDDGRCAHVVHQHVIHK